VADGWWEIDGGIAETIREYPEAILALNKRELEVILIRVLERE
jgi:hypothetical protein